MRELIGKMLEIMGKKDSNKIFWDRWKRIPDANKVFSCLVLRITLTLFSSCGHWFWNIMPKKWNVLLKYELVGL